MTKKNLSKARNILAVTYAYASWLPRVSYVRSARQQELTRPKVRVSKMQYEHGH